MSEVLKGHIDGYMEEARNLNMKFQHSGFLEIPDRDRYRNQQAQSFKSYLNFKSFTGLQETPFYTGKISSLNAISLCGFFYT